MIYETGGLNTPQFCLTTHCDGMFSARQRGDMVNSQGVYMAGKDNYWHLEIIAGGIDKQRR